MKIIIFLNSLLLIGIIDYFTFLIPDTCLIILIILIIFNFNYYNLFYSFLLFIISYSYWKKDKMGFGDVKLLSILSLLLGKSIFSIIICSLFIVILVNLIKKTDKIPLGFYLSFSTIALFFLGVLQIDL
ncbi:prepilin peptidase [Defluviitoga tunisiensis]|nr:hypothetical protein [Defluviitoga tunisiensis]